MTSTYSWPRIDQIKMGVRNPQQSVWFATLVVWTLSGTGAEAAWFKSLHSSRCPAADFRRRLELVDRVCCAPVSPGESSPCDPDVAGGAPTQCHPRCAAVWSQLRDACDDRLTTALDTMDGNDDDNAGAVADLQALCDDVTVPEIIAAMQEMQDAGCDLDTDGVGQSTVTTDTSGCSDTAPASLCSNVASGLMTCNDDFCPDCRHAGQCDRTCSFCGHRRQQIHFSDVCNAVSLP